MEKLAVLLVAAFIVLSFSMVGFASDQKMDQEENVMVYKGEVISFDQTGHIIVVKGKEGEKTFDVSQATIKGKVEPEHYVAVKYTETDGKMVASSVWEVSHKVSSNLNSSTWKELDRFANNGYAGIGADTRISQCATC